MSWITDVPSVLDDILLFLWIAAHSFLGLAMTRYFALSFLVIARSETTKQSSQSTLHVSLITRHVMLADFGKCAV